MGDESEAHELLHSQPEDESPGEEGHQHPRGNTQTLPAEEESHLVTEHIP